MLKKLQFVHGLRILGRLTLQSQAMSSTNVEPIRTRESISSRGQRKSLQSSLSMMTGGIVMNVPTSRRAGDASLLGEVKLGLIEPTTHLMTSPGDVKAIRLGQVIPTDALAANAGRIYSRQETIMSTNENASTLPSAQMTDDGTEDKGNYDPVRFNAMKHGILSKLTVLPHEDQDEYADLLSALMNEHKPTGATEAYLVEELGGIIWRKRRVLQAEGANINRGLRYTVRNADEAISSATPFEQGLSDKETSLSDFMKLTPQEVIERQREASHDLEATQKVLDILQRGGAKAYDKALLALLPDSRDWWQDYVDDEEYTPNAEGLADFIRFHLEPFCKSTETAAKHHADIKAQALGQGLQVHRLEKLSRYETHLDRKFQRTLAMLLKLKELRDGQ